MKAGLTVGGKTLAKDVSYKYAAAGQSFVPYVEPVKVVSVNWSPDWKATMIELDVQAGGTWGVQWGSVSDPSKVVMTDSTGAVREITNLVTGSNYIGILLLPHRLEIR